MLLIKVQLARGNSYLILLYVKEVSLTLMYSAPTTPVKAELLMKFEFETLVPRPVNVTAPYSFALLFVKLQPSIIR